MTDGQNYKFWITGPDGPGYKRDPYARELRGPNWNCLVRRTDFPWHETGFVTPQFSDFLIYQLHVGSFYLPQFPPSTGTFLDVIDKDVDISMLVLAASAGPEGPGPIIATMAKLVGSFPVPVTIVPGSLTDADIDGLS